jgi:hypothetical protein
LFRLFLFLTAFFGLFAAQFPDDALSAELAVNAGVGAGLALIQAFLAVAQFMFLAADRSVPIRVKAAFVSEAHRFILSKTRGRGEGLPLSLARRLPPTDWSPRRKNSHPPLKKEKIRLL